MDTQYGAAGLLNGLMDTQSHAGLNGVDTQVGGTQVSVLVSVAVVVVPRRS